MKRENGVIDREDGHESKAVMADSVSGSVESDSKHNMH